MNKKTHFIWSIAVASLIIFSSIYAHSNHSTVDSLMIIIFCIIGGFLPDIDHPKSTLGKYIKIFNYGATHRGFMHSIWAIVVLYWLTNYIFKFNIFFTIALCASFIIHLLLDTITKQGICWLYPFGKFRGPFSSGGIAEIVIFMIGFIAVISQVLRYLIYPK